MLLAPPVRREKIFELRRQKKFVLPKSDEIQIKNSIISENKVDSNQRLRKFW